MTRKSKARYGLKRTYRINPTVKALRAALLAGVMAASLAPTAATAAPFRDVVIEDDVAVGDAFVYNEEDLAALAENIAAGIVVVFVNGDAGVVNHGDISAVADASLGLNGNSAIAAGVYAYAKYDAVIVNDGDISATAIAEANGSARAYGLWAFGGESATIQNAGDISVSASGELAATSVAIKASAYGDVSVENSGALFATATVYAGYDFSLAEAVGIQAASEYGDVSISNTGLINVAAYVYDESGSYVSTASAIGIDASGYSVSIDNTGNIDAFAANDVAYGNSVAIGIQAEAYADITISNSGDISLSGSSGDGYGRYGSYPDYVYITGDFVATGISAESYIGSISVTNSGDISIVDLNAGGALSGGYTTGDSLTGISAKTLLGDSSISNSGDITLTGGETAYGIIAATDSLTEYYDCPPPYDNGNYVCYDRTGGGDAKVVNSGDITITAGFEEEFAFSYGVGIAVGTGKYGGNATIVNTGDITVVANGDSSAVGLTARSSGKYSYGSSIISNSGDITVTASYSALGIGAFSSNDAVVYNSGDITTTTEEARSVAIYAIADNTGYIRNSGDLTVVGGIGAIGAGSAGSSGATTINTGDISVTATEYYVMYNEYYGANDYLGGWAYGAFATARFVGTATVINTGDVTVNGITRGTGLSANTRYGNAYIYNSGDLTVSGEVVSAYGINSSATSYEAFLDGEEGGSEIISTGDITVTSNVFAVGIQGQEAFGDLLINSSGNVSAIVDNDEYGNALGLVGRNTYGNVDIINMGDITASSGANAIGIFAESAGYEGYYYSFPADINVKSDGDLSVTSGYGRATGIQASTTYGDVSVEVSGSVDVSGGQRSTGLRVNSQYGDIAIYTDADIAVSSGSEYALGIFAFSDFGDVNVVNYGSIEASGTSLSQGVLAGSYDGHVSVVNYGDISADSSAGYSNAVAIRSGSQGATIVNYGSLEATGDDAWTVNAVGGALDLLNYGDISGSVITDAGDDYVYNGEDGRIFLSNDTIDLGDGSNYFLNEGKVYANGTDNVINMGYYSGGGEGETITVAVTEGNYGLFVNNGSSIHMDDGAANDALTIIGDFAGTGDVNVDVDGASGNSDRLYIEGNVLAGTSNTVNIDLLSLPSAADMLAGDTIDIVSVSGTSTASNFVLGSVQTTDTALFTTDYSLVYGGGDYALGFDVTGLSNAGILLTTAAPAIQNLWYGSLGTMYQRQGAERRFSADGTADVEAAVGVWGRYYANDGSMTPDADRGNFGGGGSQNFDFSSNGLELGVGYSFNETWTIGVLAGTMEGDYKPEAGGKTDLDGNTLGAYLTYIHGNGFYADLSYRSFDFDGDVYNGPEMLNISGDADGYSLEMGYGFKTESDLEIEPQLQYSSVSVSMDDVGYGSGDYQLTDGDSSQFRLGVALRKSYQQDSGLWTPYGALSYVNVSSASNSYVIGGALEGGVDTTGGSALLELGTDARYKAWVFNAGISMQDGGAYDFVFGGQLNVRYSW